VLVPPDQDYDQRRYLRDAFTAWRTYWVDQKRTYWPEYHGAKVSAWKELRPIVWLVIGITMFLFGCWLYARSQHYQIMPYHGPTKFPPFTVPTGDS
jgi:hypothetical protein